MAGPQRGEMSATRPSSVATPFAPATADGVLAVDVGGGGVRAGVFGRDGSLRSLVSGPPPSDGEQFNPDWTWLAVAEAIRSLTSRRIQVRAVGVTTHLATTLTDAEGQPTTSAMLWRDNRASQDARDLEAALGPELRRVTGREASGESAAARMRMLTRTSPALLGRTRWLLSLKDYLVLKLTGAACTDTASASYTQLFDVRRRQWSPAIAQECGVPAAILPPTFPATTLAGRVTAAAALVTGLVPGTPVAVGGPDGSTGALGVAAHQAGVTVDVAGTTDVLLHTADAAPEHQGPGVVLNAYLLPGLWTLGGPTGLTGGGLDWLAVTMGYQSAAAAYQALEPALDAADPGDLMIRTTLTGRRLPGWDAGQRGRMEGLSAEHGPVHLLRAAEEGSIFEVRLGIDALRSGGTTVSQVILAGRPATSARAAQLRANAWGIRVGRDSDEYASLRGAALAASVAGGYFADARQAATALVAPLEWYQPEPAGATAAEERYQRWRSVMAAS
jgi:xylulokinase